MGTLAQVGLISNLGGMWVTDDSNPTFTGTATAGYVVDVMGLRDGEGVPVDVGQTSAASNGFWITSTSTLSDGGYTFYVKSYSPESPASTSQTVPIGRVVIEKGPNVAGVSFNPRLGVFDIKYVDAVGLLATSLIDPADYALAHGSRTLHPTFVRDITVPGESSTKTIAVSFSRRQTTKPGKDILTINASLAKDIAGINLDGEFRGIPPSGNDVPDSNFQAAFMVKSNNHRSVKGPAAVVMTVATNHPNKTEAREFAVAFRPGSQVPCIRIHCPDPFAPAVSLFTPCPLSDQTVDHHEPDRLLRQVVGRLHPGVVMNRK